MTIQWGFDLDMTGIRLMRRNDGQWIEIASEKIDGADIEDRLRAMVAQVGDGEAVELFLPRDQILFADINVTSDEAALDDIDKAMEGRTPYALDELELDWEMVGPDTARVAAIARETLDEAAAFAEARGLRVSGYSSLATAEDFPRAPDFGGHNLFDDPGDALDESEADAAPVQFVTKRETSKPNGPIATLTPDSSGSDEPVIRVDDSTPVMQVRSRDVAPLNPGAPIEAPKIEPRVRTDIAAAAVSPQAASLTPPAALNIRRQGTAPLRTLAVFTMALLLTVGIAVVVWNILPLGPSKSAGPEVPDTSGVELVAPAPRPETSVETAAVPEADQVEAPAVEQEVAALPEPASAPEPVPEPEPEVVAEPAPELPQPIVFADISVPESPISGDAPVLALLGAAPQSQGAPKLLNALRSGEGMPAYDPVAPLAVTPAALAGILTQAPFPGPMSADDVATGTDDIYIASVERRDLSFDAIALPGIGGFSQDALPGIEAAPAPITDEAEANAPEVAAVAPEIVEPVEPLAVPDLTSATDAATELALSEALAPVDDGSGLPQPTAFAAALSDRAPSRRPSTFVEELERRKFNGLSRQELAGIRPSRRPQSEQFAAQLESQQNQEPAPVSKLAVETSLAPKGRPSGFDRLVAAAVVQREADRLTASLDYEAPDTSAAIEAALEADAEPEPRPQDTPRLAIPSNASVARQATIDNAIRLNKVNLVGVYGTPSDRRALVRLSSGRYVKVKVGDRVDGGKVAQITDNEIIYRKGSRLVSLKLPRG